MTDLTPQPLVLASSSPYRRDLLARLGLPFTTASPDVDETPLPGETIPHLCARLGRAKAWALADRFPHHTLIGCDQSAAVGETQLQKPGSFLGAAEQLRMLSGRTVTFYTAVAVVDSARGSAVTALDATEVHVRSLTETEIARYLELERPFDCAGSFKVEGLGIGLFSKVVSDDPTALVGLPLIALCRLLREQGFAIP